MDFDVEACRRRFPGLQQRQIYFDNAGGSQTLDTVIKAVSTYLSDTNVQLGASYDVGWKSSSLYSAGTTASARFINAAESEVMTAASTTQLFRNLSFSLHFKSSDEIVLCRLNHEANTAPWLHIAERLGLKVVWWDGTLHHDPSTKNPKLPPADIRSCLTDRTRLVALPHVSNLLGTIHDIRGIAKVVHETCPRAMVCVDGVAFAPHRKIDVKDLGIDFYAFSWYKVYGPHIALLYASAPAQKQLRSFSHYFNPSDTLEDRLGLAGASYEMTAAIPAVLEYLGGAELDTFFNPSSVHEERLQGILLDYLKSRRDVVIYGEPSSSRSDRVPTVSFEFPQHSSKAILEAIETVRSGRGKQYGLRCGRFYANRLCDALGVGDEGALRVSLVHYNTVEEVQGFVSLLNELLDGPKARL